MGAWRFCRSSRIVRRRAYDMKRKLLSICFAAAVLLTACGSPTPAASKTEEVDQAASEMKDTLGDSVQLPSEAVANVLAKTWNVPENGDVYAMQTDGTGTKNGTPFTFKCGFDEDNNITLSVKNDGSEKEDVYAISADKTGYGIQLSSLDGGEDIYMFPADLKLIDMADERVSGIVGEWSDASDNKYCFDKDSRLIIRTGENETEGTYSVVENEEGTLLMNLVVPGGALEYAFTLDQTGKTLELCSPGTDIVHQWTKQK